MSNILVFTVISIIHIYIFISLFAINCALTETETETEFNQLFNKIIIKNNISSSSSEFKLRKRIFFENVNKVKELNSNERGTAVFKVSEESIYSEGELGDKFGLIIPDSTTKYVYLPSRHKKFEVLWNDLAKGKSDFELIAKLPKQFDWRTSKPGSISRVKDQTSKLSDDNR